MGENRKSRVIINYITVFLFLPLFSFSQTWQWAKSEGGISNGRAICTDGLGNCYVAVDSSGQANVFKYNSLGVSIWKRKAWTGSVKAIVSDNAGYVYVAGDSSSQIKIAKFDLSGNMIWKVNSGSGSCNGISFCNSGNLYVLADGTSFLQKLDTLGNLIWTQPASATGTSIFTDALGDSYITGYFYGAVLFGTYALTAKGSQDIFVTKYASTGNCMWANRAGGKCNASCFSNDCGYGITLDAIGNIYLTGSFTDSADFDSNILSAQASDIFIAKYNSINSSVIWVKQATGLSDQEGRCIAIDNQENILIAGSYVPTTNFSGFPLTGWGNYDAFVAKYDSTGSFMSVMKAGGTSWNEYIYGISSDNLGNTFVAGSFSNTAYFGADSLTSLGGYDMFVGKIDISTGIGEIDINSYDINIYPNPANTQITVGFELSETKNASIEIKNILGQIVKTVSNSSFSKGSNKIGIDITDFSNGLYFVQFQNANKVISKKFIKQ